MLKDKLKSFVSLFGKYAIAGLAFAIGSCLAIYAVWAFKGPTTGPGAGVTESTDKGSYIGNTAVTYYITTNIYNGSTAGSACDAGYHMCLWNKDTLKKNFVWDVNKSSTLTNNTAANGNIYWIDGDSNSSAAGSNPDCNNWSTGAGGNYGMVRILGAGYDGYSTGYTCDSVLRVMCCKD